MRTRVIGSVAALALAAPISLAIDAGSADAASLHYRNCTALSHRYHHGVAKSRKAALKQVRAGYHIPAYGSRARKVYWANYKSLDRDRDGTACER
ncbi:MAG TPA: excalibur calcium-binding domain-containing protein [Marmoricola sp.]